MRLDLGLWLAGGVLALIAACSACCSGRLPATIRWSLALPRGRRMGALGAAGVDLPGLDRPRRWSDLADHCGRVAPRGLPAPAGRHLRRRGCDAGGRRLTILAWLCSVTRAASPGGRNAAPATGRNGSSTRRAASEALALFAPAAVLLAIGAAWSSPLPAARAGSCFSACASLRPAWVWALAAALAAESRVLGGMRLRRFALEGILPLPREPAPGSKPCAPDIPCSRWPGCSAPLELGRHGGALARPGSRSAAPGGLAAGRHST